jgi:hypothetical protein
MKIRAGGANFQVRHPRCVDRITGVDKCSHTAINICTVLLYVKSAKN